MNYNLGTTQVGYVVNIYYDKVLRGLDNFEIDSTYTNLEEHPSISATTDMMMTTRTYDLLSTVPMKQSQHVRCKPLWDAMQLDCTGHGAMCIRDWILSRRQLLLLLNPETA